MSLWTRRLALRTRLYQRAVNQRKVANDKVAERLEQVKEAQAAVDAERATSAAVPSSLSPAGLKLIMFHEGLRQHAYKDAVGVWTIGYGHTSGVREGQVISLDQAVEFLKRDAKNAEGYVKYAAQMAGIRLNQNQFDALTSFTFNLGSGPLSAGRSLGDALQKKDHQAVADSLLLYVKGRNPRTGQLELLPGLVTRRRAERSLFIS